jgi:hypothetical protein
VCGWDAFFNCLCLLCCQKKVRCGKSLPSFAHLGVGTLTASSFTAARWDGTSYPKGMKSSDNLTHYTNKFKTVEISSTYYGAAIRFNGDAVAR